MVGDILYSIIGFIIGIFLFFKGFVWLKQKRLIENIPTSKIRSIAMGLIEIAGEVVPAQGKILKSPFSNKDCVYYKYTIEEYRRSGKYGPWLTGKKGLSLENLLDLLTSSKTGRRGRWVTVKKGEDGTHFYLKDKTGSAMVDPNGANVDIPKDFEFNSGIGEDPPESVMNFLKANNLSFEGFLGINKRMRYREYFIAPKEKVYIMGTAGDNPFVEEATAKKGVEDVMISKGENEKFYYISDKPEHEVLKNLKWKVIGGIFGGSLLSIWFLKEILKYFGLL